MNQVKSGDLCGIAEATTQTQTVVFSVMALVD
jgi:hypothetical protein